MKKSLYSNTSASTPLQKSSYTTEEKAMARFKLERIAGTTLLLLAKESAYQDPSVYLIRENICKPGIKQMGQLAFPAETLRCSINNKTGKIRLNENWKKAFYRTLDEEVGTVNQQPFRAPYQPVGIFHAPTINADLHVFCIGCKEEHPFLLEDTMEVSPFGWESVHTICKLDLRPGMHDLFKWFYLHHMENMCSFFTRIGTWR